MPSTKKPRGNDDDDDDDEEEEYRYLVCPKCRYTIDMKSNSKKAVMCPKCGARMVKSTTRGRIKPKDMADSIADICREIREKK